jgi:hypothetical protein
MANGHQTSTPAWQLALAWAWVGVPLFLGVLQTVINAMKLFSPARARPLTSGLGI